MKSIIIKCIKKLETYCDIVIYNKYYLVSIPVFGTELLKHLGFFKMRATKVSLFMLIWHILDLT